MVGMGTVVNVAAIAGGSLLGLLVGRGIKEKYQETVIYGLALCVIVLGIQMALQGQHILLTIISLVVGSILGEALGIEEKLEQVGTLLAEKFQKSRKKGDAGTDAFVEGFLNASHLCNSFDHWLEYVCIIVGGFTLQCHAETFKAHTCVDNFGRKCFEATIGFAIILHKHKVPYLDHLGMVMINKVTTGNLSTFFCRTKIYVNL